MQSDNATVRRDRDRQYPDPAAARPFRLDLGVEDKAPVALQPEVPQLLQGGSGLLAVAPDGPFALDRRSGGQAEQFVDPVGPCQAILVRDVTVPVAFVG